MRKITAKVYNETIFEAMIREHRSGYIEAQEIRIRYPINVVYVDDNGQQRTGTPQEMTETQLWDAAVEKVQHLTAHGATHELVTLRRKETRSTVVDVEQQRSLFDAEDDLYNTLKQETDERFDRMLGR